MRDLPEQEDFLWFLGMKPRRLPVLSRKNIFAASTITIPFTGYVGITQSACTCAVGTLPTGITVKPILQQHPVQQESWNFL